MARKKKEAPIEANEPEVKKFEYGDLSVVCSCGRIQTISKGINRGLQLILATREDSYVQLKCDECNADIKLCFLEGVKPEEPNEITEPIASIEIVEKGTDEIVQEESKQEQSL